MIVRSRQMLAALLVTSLLAGPALADVKAGVDSWLAGKYDAAVKEWRPLAEAGDPDAQFNMGQAYKLGRGVPSDLKLAQTWYEKAAQQGHQQAQANLGLILFQNGDRTAAMPWIDKAAKAGDPRAQYVLGTALFNGDVVGKDWPRAYGMMTAAAAQGLPQAATTLTEMDAMIPLADRQKGLALAKQMTVPAAPVPVVGTAKPSRNTIAVAPLPPSTPKPQAAKPAAPPLKPAPKPAPAPSPAAAGGKWRVQLGAYGSVAGARGQWSELSRRIAALSGLQPSYEPAGALTRLRVGPLANRAAADRVCAAAKAAGQACFPIAP